MKTGKISLALAGLAIITSFQILQAAELSKPIVISPAIGDTLDKFECNRYGLFEHTSGFQSATYSMGDDSILFAKVITKRGSKVDSQIINCGSTQEYIDKNFPSKLSSNPTWANSAFIGIGFGNPLGYKYELGVNLAGHVTPFLFGRSHDSWSNDKDEGQFGIGIRFIGPFVDSRLAPFVSFETASKLVLWGSPDSYKSYSFGATVTATRWLQIRPEFGSAHTFRWVSGGSGLFGDIGPLVYAEEDQYMFNIGFEFDLNGIF